MTLPTCDGEFPTVDGVTHPKRQQTAEDGSEDTSIGRRLKLTHRKRQRPAQTYPPQTAEAGSGEEEENG